MVDPENPFGRGGYCVAEGHERPLMERWGGLSYKSQILGVCVWGGGGRAAYQNQFKDICLHPLLGVKHR